LQSRFLGIIELSQFVYILALEPKPTFTPAKKIVATVVNMTLADTKNPGCLTDLLTDLLKALS
jgi:hypothetical protein